MSENTENFEDRIKSCTNNDEVLRLWKEKNEHNDKVFVKDGIVDNSVWNAQDKKILYILKEAYGETEDWDLTDRVLKKDSILSSPTWRSVVEWTYGIHKTSAEEIAKYIPKEIHKIRDELIRKIAVLNLKKSDGNSHSDNLQIKQYAENDIELIKKQIELISPNIIVCGSTLSALNEALKAKGHKPVYSNDSKCDNWFYYTEVFTGSETLVIDYYHPSIRWAALVNYYAVTSIYQQALLKKNALKGAQ